MNCAGFDRWLDEGRPAAGADAARAHADGCAHCDAAESAARAIEHGLSLGHEPAAPAGFTDAVMLRVRAVVQEPAAASSLAPWWAEALAEPALTVSLLLAALLAWSHAQVWALARVLASQFMLWSGGVLRGASLPALAPTAAALRPWSQPYLLLGLLLVIGPALALGFVWLFRLTERLASLTRRAK